MSNYAIGSASAIIVTYNSAEQIRPCLDALQRQPQAPAEIIIYDNASSDGTPDLVRAAYADARLIVGDTNIGFAAASNRAAARATGDYLIFLNPDTIVQPGWMMPLLDALASDASVGAVTPQILFAKQPHRVNTCGNQIHLSGITYCLGIGEPPMGGSPVDVSAVSGAAFAIKQALFQQMGGFEEHLFLYYEDTDLSLRLRRAGWRILVVPEAQVWHDYRTSFMPSKLYYLERNRYLSLLSVLPARLLALMLPSMLVMDIATWAYCLLHSRAALAAKWHAWSDVMASVPWLRQRRRSLAGMPVSMSGLLSGLSSYLHVDYAGVAGGLGYRVLDAIGWLTAAPMLAIGRRFTERRREL
jgi:GT2 family glycosyltransferase